MTRTKVITILTLIIVGVWLAIAVISLFFPLPEAGVLDSVVPLVIGYWFATKPEKGNESED